MATLDVSTVDLEALTSAVRSKCVVDPEGPVVGRTFIRDVVTEELGCSMLEAEQLVDTLVARAFLRLEQSEDGRQLWRFYAGA